MKRVSTSNAGRLRTHLIKGAAGSFVLQVGFAGLAFFNAIILARVLGPEGYGAFANAMAWVSLLTIPATFGFGILLVRNIAIYRSEGNWPLLKGLLRFSNRFVMTLSVVLALAAAGVAEFVFSAPAQTTMRHTVWLAVLLLPLLALYNLREAATRGLEYVIRARLPGMIVRPGLLMCGMLAICLLWPNRLSAPTAMGINVGAGAVALGLGVFFLQRLLPTKAKVATAEYTPKPWLKAAFPMLIFGGTQIVLGQTDIVMLGAMRGTHEVGLYAAACKLAYLLVFVTFSAEVILAPVISRLYANAEMEHLQHVLTKSVRIAFFATFPFGLILVFWGRDALAVFGNEFMASAIALSILALGHLAEVALGSGSLVLSMTGNERVVAIVLSVIVAANIGLNILLIPRHGMNGAAVASTISLVAAKFTLMLFSVKKTRLQLTILGNVIQQRALRINE